MTAPILILGGSAEARRLANHIPDAVIWLPEPDRMADGWSHPVVTDPQDAGPLTAVIDAAHPCEAHTPLRAMAFARAQQVPLVRLRRPAWRPARNDRWWMVRTPQSARAAVPTSARVFVGLGREGLRQLGPMPHRYVLCRQLSTHHDPCPVWRGRYLRGRAPFGLSEEIAFLRREAIDWLVVRNAGGGGAWPKLAAARALGLNVAMIARPPLPNAPTVTTVAETLKRVAQWHR